MYDDKLCLERYRCFADAHPELMANEDGCPTRILNDIDEIEYARSAVRAEREARNLPTLDLRVGVLGEDHHIGWLVRDAVRFSDGRYGLYNRVLPPGGVIVLPILGKAVALLRIFRHAARRWFLEAPQGGLPEDTAPATEARRELIEEIGAEARDLFPLGTLYTSTALSSERLEMFAAHIPSVGQPQRSEGIMSVPVVPVRELDLLIAKGEICDGPTIAVIARARIAGLM